MLMAVKELSVSYQLWSGHQEGYYTIGSESLLYSRANGIEWISHFKSWSQYKLIINNSRWLLESWSFWHDWHLRSVQFTYCLVGPSQRPIITRYEILNMRPYTHTHKILSLSHTHRTRKSEALFFLGHSGWKWSDGAAERQLENLEMTWAGMSILEPVSLPLLPLRISFSIFNSPYPNPPYPPPSILHSSQSLLGTCIARDV